MNISTSIRTVLRGETVRPKPEDALNRLAELYTASEDAEERNAGIAIHNLALDLMKTRQYTDYKAEEGRNRSYQEIYRSRYIQDLIQEETMGY